MSPAIKGKALRKKDRAKEIQSSRFFGVSYLHHNRHGNRPGKPWQATIHDNGRHIWLGAYKTEEEAAEIAAKARAERDAGTLRLTGQKKSIGHAVVAARFSKGQPTIEAGVEP